MIYFLAQVLSSAPDSDSSACTSPSMAGDRRNRKRAIEEEVFVPDSPVERTQSMPVPIPEAKEPDDNEISEQLHASREVLQGLMSCPPVMSESPLGMARQLSASPNPTTSR